MKARKASVVLLVLLAGVLFITLTPGTFLSLPSQKKSPENSLFLLRYVADLIKNNYVEEPNPVRTMQGALRGLVGPLDPLSSYLEPENVTKYKALPSMAFGETGIIVYKKFGTYPTVIGVVENSPAEKAGIREGDHISQMEGQPLLMLSMTETNLHLKAQELVPVSLKVLRTESSEELIVERIRLHEAPFTFTPAEKTAGILKIHRFYPPCAGMIKEKLLGRLDEQKKTLVIDLRNCAEGSLEEALRFVNLFLQTKEAGFLQSKDGTREVLSCPEEPTWGGLPLVIWTNRATLGPAEAVSGILRKSGRARILGFRTPGLIAVQDLYTLEDGSGLLLTSKIFVLPGREEVWLKGVEPDHQMDGEDISTASYLKKTLSFLADPDR